MSVRRTRALTLSFACALAIAPIAAQGSFKSALSKDTILLISAPNISASLAEMREMPLFKIWAEQEVQDFFADSLQMGAAYWEMALEQGRAMHEQGMLPFSPDDLTKLRLDSVSLAITRLRMIRGQDLVINPVVNAVKGEVGMLLHAEFGDSANIWRRVIETALEKAAEEAGDQI